MNKNGSGCWSRACQLEKQVTGARHLNEIKPEVENKQKSDAYRRAKFKVHWVGLFETGSLMEQRFENHPKAVEKNWPCASNSTESTLLGLIDNPLDDVFIVDIMQLGIYDVFVSISFECRSISTVAAIVYYARSVSFCSFVPTFDAPISGFFFSSLFSISFRYFSSLFSLFPSFFSLSFFFFFFFFFVYFKVGTSSAILVYVSSVQWPTALMLCFDALPQIKDIIVHSFTSKYWSLLWKLWTFFFWLKLEPLSNQVRQTQRSTASVSTF